MADIDVVVALNDKQFQAAISKMEASVDKFSSSIDKSFGKMQKTFNNISAGSKLAENSLKALIAAVSVGQLADFADSVTNAKNKLAQLSDTQEGAAKQFDAMTAVAIRSRTSLEDVSSLYFRLARSADQVGISQREAASITESVAKALVASGQSASEAAGPLLQLGQAFASGKFQGDELRSILEGLNPVSKALAAYLKVPVGSLKELGAQGKITARDFVQAMKEAGASIEKDFAKTIPTIGQAMTVLKTSLQASFNNFENTTEAGRRTGQAIQVLAMLVFEASTKIDSFLEEWGWLLKLVADVAAFFLVNKALRLLGSALVFVTSGLVEAGAAVSAAWASFKAGTGILGNLVKNFNLIWEQFGMMSSWSLRLKTVIEQLIKPFQAFFALLGSGIAAVAAFFGVDFVSDTVSEVTDATGTMAQRLDEFNKKLNETKTGLSDTAGIPVFDTTAIDKQISGLKDSNAEKIRAIQLETALIGKSTEYIAREKAKADIENERRAAIKKLTDEHGDAAARDSEVQKQLSSSIAKVNAEYDAQVNSILAAVDAQTKAQEANRMAIFANEQLEESWKRLQDIQNETAKIGLPLIEQKYRDIEDAATQAIRAQVAAEAQARGIKPSDMPIEDVDKITNAVRQQLDYEKELVVAQEKKNRNREIELFQTRELQNANQQVADIYNKMQGETLPTIVRQEQEILLAARARAREEIQAEEARRGSPMDKDEITAYYKAAEEGAKRLSQATKDQYDQSRTWSTGWKKALNQYVEDSTDAASQVEQIFKKTMTSMEDAFVEFSKTGKFEWKSFMNSIIEDMLRAQFRQLVGGIFGGADSGTGKKQQASGGGIMNGISSLFGGFFATGGMIPPGRFGIVGENGPEYVQGPATVTPEAQMGGSVTYNINAVDALSFKQMIASDPTFLFAVTEQGRRKLPGGR
jgi:lambda family phage tail tape measure protein